jgi:hypothetical protein
LPHATPHHSSPDLHSIPFHTNPCHLFALKDYCCCLLYSATFLFPVSCFLSFFLFSCPWFLLVSSYFFFVFSCFFLFFLVFSCFLFLFVSYFFLFLLIAFFSRILSETFRKYICFIFLVFDYDTLNYAVSPNNIFWILSKSFIHFIIPYFPITK